MTDCFSKVSPSAATSTLALATEYDGKPHSASSFNDSSTSASSSRVYPSRGHEDPNGVDHSGEQGFRTQSSDIGYYSWGEQWAFGMFSSERTSYPGHASDSRRLLEESVDQLNREGPSWSAQGGRQNLGTNQAYMSSMSIDAATTSPPESSDGAAVVALLSSPNFTIQSLEDGELDEEPELERNRCKMPQVKPGTDRELSHPATVNPLWKFNREASVVPERGTCDPVTAKSSSARTPSNPPSASEVVQPWIGMYNSYLVDVWDVLGLAKEYVYSETVIPHGDAEVLDRECSATSRLTMIRKHINYLDKW